jgi:hypothetical protein
MRRLIRVVLTVASLMGLGSGATVGDVLRPGAKPPRYSVWLFLEGMERFPGLEFFLQPTNMTGRAERVTPEKNALGWYKFAHPSLYAVRGPLRPGASDTEAFVAAPRLASCRSCLEVSTKGKPAAGVSDVRIYLRVEALESSELKIVPVREEHRDTKGRLLSTLRR